MAKTFHQRPSAVLGFADAGDYMAFCLDRAVWYFGICVESDMDKVEDELPEKAGKVDRERARQKVFDAYMGKKDTTRKGQFADPVAIAKKRT